MGGENHAVLAGAVVDLLDRTEDPDVRVEVGDGFDPWTLQQVSQQPWLDCRRELHHVIGRRHTLRVVNADFMDRKDLEGLLSAIKLTGRVIDDQYAASAIRVGSFERLSENPGMRGVIPRDNRADIHPGSPFSGVFRGIMKYSSLVECGLDSNPALTAQRLLCQT